MSCVECLVPLNPPPGFLFLSLTASIVFFKMFIKQDAWASSGVKSWWRHIPLKGLVTCIWKAVEWMLGPNHLVMNHVVLLQAYYVLSTDV